MAADDVGAALQEQPICGLQLPAGSTPGHPGRAGPSENFPLQPGPPEDQAGFARPIGTGAPVQVHTAGLQPIPGGTPGLVLVTSVLLSPHGMGNAPRRALMGVSPHLSLQNHARSTDDSHRTVPRRDHQPQMSSGGN